MLLCCGVYRFRRQEYSCFLSPHGAEHYYLDLVSVAGLHSSFSAGFNPRHTDSITFFYFYFFNSILQVRLQAVTVCFVFLRQCSYWAQFELVVDRGLQTRGREGEHRWLKVFGAEGGGKIIGKKGGGLWGARRGRFRRDGVGRGRG